MPIHHAIWKVGSTPAPLSVTHLASEQALEDMIVRDPRILSSEWMLIGRQEITPFAGRIDLLAIAPDGSLVLIELKRNRTPREIVAQALDYAAWVDALTTDKIAQIYQRFSKGRNLSDDFKARFGAKLDEETLAAVRRENGLKLAVWRKAQKETPEAPETPESEEESTEEVNEEALKNNFAAFLLANKKK